MALWVCEDCSTKYSVDADACPQCGSKNWSEEGESRGSSSSASPSPKKSSNVGTKK